MQPPKLQTQVSPSLRCQTLPEVSNILTTDTRPTTTERRTQKKNRSKLTPPDPTQGRRTVSRLQCQYSLNTDAKANIIYGKKITNYSCTCPAAYLTLAPRALL
jgi:hypothetical protein